MRNRFLVTYDISDQKRLRKVFKKMKSFGLHLQFSVFECELSAKELVLMNAAVDGLLNHAVDQILVIDLGPSDGRGGQCIRAMGRPYLPLERKPVVV